MDKFTTKTALTALAAVLLLSGCDRFGDLALTCSGTEKRVTNTLTREGELQGVPLTVVRDWLGNPKSIHFSTKLGADFNGAFCENGKAGEQVFKSPNCANGLTTITFYPDHGKVRISYHASSMDDWLEADLACTKAKGIR